MRLCTKTAGLRYFFACQVQPSVCLPCTACGIFCFTGELVYINKQYKARASVSDCVQQTGGKDVDAMSRPWNIRKGMDTAQGPNGEYDNTGEFSNGVNAKRIRNNLWPSGKFNDQDGPLSALQNSDSTMRSMSKNLSTNQTVMTLYINIPRLVVPINIPRIHEPFNLAVAKCICAGDVVFQLRYNEVLLKSGDATRVTNRYMPDLVYCANLATINYLLLGIQTLLAEVYVSSIEPNVVATQAQFSMLWEAQKAVWSRSHEPVDQARMHYHKFLNVISMGDFGMMMSYYFFDGYAEKVDFDNDSDRIRKDKYLAYVDEFLWDFINTYAKIGGIFIGSDHQGGAHYGDPNPASYAPTDFVGTLQVAGKNFKVRNMWSACQGGTSSGDILGFKLKFFKTKPVGHPPVVFRLSSNSVTQNEQTVGVSHAICKLGGYSMLVPSKNKRDTVRNDMVMAEERSNGFLQFGICDQISKPSNTFNNPLISACDATASVVPAPFQIYMRLGFTNVPSVNILMFPAPEFNKEHIPRPPLSPPPRSLPPSYNSDMMPPLSVPSSPVPSSPVRLVSTGLGGPLLFENVSSTSDTHPLPGTTNVDAANAEEPPTDGQSSASTSTAESTSVNPTASRRRTKKIVAPVADADTAPGSNAMHTEPA